MKHFYTLPLILLALLVLVPCLAQAPETRASHLGPLTVGVGKGMHMAEFLREYPGCRTAILCYLKLDTDDVHSTVQTIHAQAAMQQRMGREFWPQIALETGTLSLSEFRRELSRPGSRVEQNVRLLAQGIARYSSQNKWFFLRPFSEMNDAADNGPWEFANKAHANTPQDFAAAWVQLRAAFDREGATNAIFVFSPLAAYRVHHEPEIQATLKLIPAGWIDAFGLNVYSRPMTAYGGKSQEPISFAELTQPWLKLLAGSHHHGIPLVVSEMAVSSQANDARRAAWLRETFRFTRSHGFVMVTYFNYAHPFWHLDEHSLAEGTLRAEMTAP